jgi:purine-binding chemotaxis protein CheW
MRLNSMAKVKLFHFSVQKVHGCLDYSFIKRILPLCHLEMVPNAPDYLAGLLNLQGKSVPVIDLALWLNLPREEEYSLNTPILLCQAKDFQVGLIIDKIFGFVEIEEENIQLSERFKESHFSGSFTLADISVLIIDINKLLSFKFVHD